MAASLIGLKVIVVLKSNEVLSGTVYNVLNQQLYLRDVFFLNTRRSVQDLVLSGHQIEDCEVIEEQNALPSQLPGDQGAQELVRQDSNRLPAKKQQFTTTIPFALRPSQLPPASHKWDLVAKPAIAANNEPQLPQLGTTRSPNSIQENNITAEIPKELHEHRKPTGQQPQRDAPEDRTAVELYATLEQPFNGLSLGQETSSKGHTDADQNKIEGELIEESLAQDRNAPKKRRKRGKKGPNTNDAPALESDSAPGAWPLQSSEAGLGAKGWRSTPIIEHKEWKDAGPKPKGKVVPMLLTGKRQQRSAREEDRKAKSMIQSGWATEDATDVQAMEEFDFAGNLSKFDKLAVFEELRQGDTTADEDRLVYHNRVKPANDLSRKLANSEYVLGQQSRSPQHFPSSDDEEAVDMSGSFSSARPRARRDHSHSSIARRPIRSKQGSFQDELAHPTHITSAPMTRSNTMDQSNLTRQHLLPNLRSSVSGLTPITLSRPQLRYMHEDRLVHPVTPSTLMAIEKAGEEEFRISVDIQAENAARGIVDVVLSILNPGGRRLAQNHNATPVVVVLIGGDVGSATKALATARHLRERNIQVVAASARADWFHRSDPNDAIALQLSRLGDGFLMGWRETEEYLKTLKSPPELIIDALAGVHQPLESAIAKQAPLPQWTDTLLMMTYANKSSASVLSIDLPTGIHPDSGEVKVQQGEPLEVRAKVIVCCGGVTTGLFRAMELRGDRDEWRVYVADVGLNPASRGVLAALHGKKKPRQLARFGTDWVVRVQYENPDDAVDLAEAVAASRRPSR